MRMTNNEKKVLKLLLENAKISDIVISKKLKISSQAVGKIRKKLENSIIDSYTVNLNYSKLGIQTFAISLSKLTHEGLDLGELEVEEKLLNFPNIIQIYRLPNSSATHIILYGFRDINELDDFFHSSKNKELLHRFIENKELFTFSHNSLIKNKPLDLFNKVIDNIKNSTPKNGFLELENFKKRIGS